MMSRTPPEVIRVSLQEALADEQRLDFVRAEFLRGMPVAPDQHTDLMVDFATILRAAGHDVAFETLQRLAYVAMGEA
jgi:hypothetical protein